jgi:hypothetical protein
VQAKADALTSIREGFMSGKPEKPNHEADISNANKGTPGTNQTYDKAQGNRGKQLDPKQQGKKKG